MSKSGWIGHCAELCKRAKYIGEEVIWQERSNHRGAVHAAAVVLDEDRLVIPGLQFHGEVQSRKYGPYQKYSLMIGLQGRRLRVFALEVMPDYHRSHVQEGQTIYGPHIQIGDERESGLSHIARPCVCKLDARSINGWIERFRRHARVYDGDEYPLSPPFENDLFGL